MSFWCKDFFKIQIIKNYLYQLDPQVILKQMRKDLDKQAFKHIRIMKVRQTNKQADRLKEV